MTHCRVADVDGQAEDTELDNGIGDRSALSQALILVAVGGHQHRDYLLHTISIRRNL
jgi:hypothetical protein